MREHNHYGEHVNHADLEEWLEDFGEIMGNENEIICPHCGLIIDPKTEEGVVKALQSTTNDQETDKPCNLFIDTETECPECKEKYVIVSCTDHTYYYTAAADME